MHSHPDAILLCGGAGMRLRSVVADAPKGLARVAGRPIMELLICQLRRHGFERVILAVGYQQEAIRSHFGDHAFGVQLRYSTEAEALGTGGALRHAARLVDSERVLLMNGDSYTDVDIGAFIGYHNESAADVSIVAVSNDGRNDCGLVGADTSGRVSQFSEKQADAACCYVNAGIYLLSRALVDDIPTGRQVSLERELLPRWLAEYKNIHAFHHLGKCIDIGTPARFAMAQELLARVELTADTASEVHER